MSGKVAASILSADFAYLGDQVKMVEPYADLIHIDAMDAHFVPPLSVGPVVVESIRRITALPLHCHLMVEQPELLLEDFAAAGADIVTCHVEAVVDPAPTIRKAEALGIRAGLAVNPSTPVDELFPHLESLDRVLVMSVNPGWAGQPFLESALPKIERVRREIDRHGLDVEVEVDGGIDGATVPRGGGHRAGRGVFHLQGVGPRRRDPSPGRSGGEDPMSETVLVVDDDPDVSRFVEVNLRSAGYDVTVAVDGVEAIERALEIRPDLILLDVMMPGLDGFEVAQRLRRDPRTSSSSIIMLTAKALSADKVLGLSSGADDYIIKPFDPVELLARVKGTLRRAREMRALSPLTGFPGNIRIQDEIQRRVAEEMPFALLYADLDYFKAYNDFYGFVRGDRAIQTLARLSA